MKVMTAQNLDVNIYDITYPCYVAGIPPGAKRIIHAPGQFEYTFLDNVRSFVVEAYKTPERLYVFDVVPYHLWVKQICQIPFEKRLKFLRTMCTSQISNFDKVMDLPAVLIDTPFKLHEYCDELLTKGYETVRIMDVNGFYVFGECQNGEYMELKI